MQKIKYILYLTILAVGTGCIRNDIPYPRIHANILSITAKDESQAAKIDSISRTATLYFGEDADIYNVTISHYSLTPKAEIAQGDLARPIDLSEPYHITLRIYQDYEWTIIASQQIERYFKVSGQIGASIIDTDNHTVKAYVSKSTPLSSITVERCKLGATSSVAQPDLTGKRVDFTNPIEVEIDNFGHKQTWTISVEHTDTPVSTVSADAWTCVMWVYGEGETGKDNTIQYRIKGDTEWLTVPKQWLTVDGGSFCARITGLQPNTSYETRAVCGDQHGETIEVTTGQIIQMPNCDFDQWWLDGKVWDPWPKDGAPYWDTGNKGASTLGQSNSVPTDDTVDGSGKAAMLQTKFVGIGSLGKLAAGNIFVGSYVKTDGTNGILSFGRQFTERPTRLTGYLKYKTAPISSVTAGFEALKGQPDTCSIWIALVDLPEPLEIRTNPKDRQLFDPEASYVVAYGKYQSGDDIPEYMPFDITLEYRSTDRVPRYIICTASASKYGDYFTGGNGSVLYVDDFRLEYDY